MAYRSNWPQTKSMKIENHIVESLDSASYEFRLGLSRLDLAIQDKKGEKARLQYGLPATIAELTKTVIDVNSAIENLDGILTSLDGYTPRKPLFTSLRQFFGRKDSVAEPFKSQMSDRIKNLLELRDKLMSKFEMMLVDIDKWGIENPEVDTFDVDQHKFGGDLQDGRADFARKIFADSGWKAKKLLTDKLPKLIDSTQLETSIATMEMFDQGVNAVELTTIDLQDSAPVSPEFTDDFEEISAEHALASFTELDLPYDPEENRRHNPDEFEFSTVEADFDLDLSEKEVLISTDIQPIGDQKSTAGFFDLYSGDSDTKPIKPTSVQDSSRPSLIKKWVLGVAAVSVAVVGSGAVVFGGDAGVEQRSIGQNEDELAVTVTIPTHPLSARDSKGSDRNQASQVETVEPQSADKGIPASAVLEPEIGTSAVQNKLDKSATQKRKATVSTRSKAAKVNAQSRANQPEAMVPIAPKRISDAISPVVSTTAPSTSITTTSSPSTTTSTTTPTSSTTTSTVPASTTSTTSTIPTEATTSTTTPTSSTVVDPVVPEVANVPIRATSAPAGLEPIEISFSR